MPYIPNLLIWEMFNLTLLYFIGLILKKRKYNLHVSLLWPMLWEIISRDYLLPSLKAIDSH